MSDPACSSARHRVPACCVLLTAPALVHTEIATCCFRASISVVHLRKMSMSIKASATLQKRLARPSTRLGYIRRNHRPAQQSSKPRSLVMIYCRRWSLISIASETLGESVVEVNRLPNVSDLQIAATCAISRKLPRMAVVKAIQPFGPCQFQETVGQHGSASTQWITISSLPNPTTASESVAGRAVRDQRNNGDEWMSYVAFRRPLFFKRGASLLWSLEHSAAIQYRCKEAP